MVFRGSRIHRDPVVRAGGAQRRLRACVQRAAIVVVLGGWIALGGAVAARAEPATAPGAGRLGDAACASCHAESVAAYAESIHARVMGEQSSTPTRAARGCEGCHGPGEEHVRSGGKGDGGPGWIAFGSRDPDVIRRENEACTTCHAGGTQRLWEGSPHETRDVGCASCHQVKQPATARHLLVAADQTTMCGECHPAARAQQLRNRHMPTRPGVAGGGGEGFMDCGSCHDPHGTISEALISAHSVNDSCYSCHAEKRGPFLWEHVPVNENCLNCHEAHGSIRPAMLKLPAARLCQSCHIETSHPSQNRGPSDRFTVGQNCQHCHSRIHGSNHPSGSFFTR